MNQTLTQMLETIDDEIKCYREMQTILTQEREAATRSNRDQLMRVGQAKQALVQTLTQTENRRQALADKLATRYGIQDRPLTVSKLCACLETPYATRLKALASSLKTLVETVQRENSANAKLFSHTLELIHGSLKLLNDLIYSHAVYQKPGNEHRRPGYGVGRGRVFCGTV
jgi:flagellar biosynthesis/type III secretory pathway chaperone